jgi:hypothetical protein
VLTQKVGGLLVDHDQTGDVVGVEVLNAAGVRMDGLPVSTPVSCSTCPTGECADGCRMEGFADDRK